jgi:hypothetical protein
MYGVSANIILVTLQEWNRVVEAEYRELMEGLDKDDHEGRAERMRPILEELQKMGLDPDLQTDPVARMRAVVKHLQVFVSPRSFTQAAD